MNALGLRSFSTATSSRVYLLLRNLGSSNTTTTMLKSGVTRICAHRRCLSYFSSTFNNIANQNLANERGVNFDLDIFVNQDHRPMDTLEKLAKLRKQKDCTNVPLLPNLLVKQLLDLSGSQDAVNALLNPLQFGIFIDQFTGCHLLDLLLHNGNAREAAQVSGLLVDRGFCNNELVASLAVKSYYEFLKEYKPSPPAKEGKPEVEKVRVKFLRNFPEETSVKTEEKLLGETLIKLGSSSSLESQLAKNVTLLGLVLNDTYTEAEEWISKNEKQLNKDVLQLGVRIVESLEGRSNPEFKTLLEKALSECKQSSSFEEILDARVKQSAAEMEPKLVAEYEKSLQEWKTKFKRAVDEQMKLLDTNARIESIKNTLSTMKSERQNLWYFENKEEIDIQIFKKQVFYPKRWFGKKKKPRTVDALYVPPTITRTH